METLPIVSLRPESTQVDSGIISVFITNLGKYNEGELVGEWIALPTTPEYVTQCLERIGVDGVYYEEFFFTDYESSISGVSEYISEYSNLNELNYLASRLEELSHHDIELYEAVIDIGGYVQSVTDLINLVDNLKVLGNLTNYFDYERYGHDIALEQGCVSLYMVIYVSMRGHSKFNILIA